MGMMNHALNAITLVPRERNCDHNRNPVYAHCKIIDVDIYVAGQQRGTWRYEPNSKQYWLSLELLDDKGAMYYAGFLRDIAAEHALKATTAELLIAGKLPTRRQYFEREVMMFVLDNKLKIFFTAAVLVIGLRYLL